MSEQKSKLNTFESIKAALEELELQVKLGSMEAADLFKNRRKDFKEFAEEVKQKTAEWATENGEKVEKVKITAQEIIDILEADYDISYHEYESRQKVNDSLNNFEMAYNAFVSQLEEQFKEKDLDWKKKAEESFSKFRVSLAVEKMRSGAEKDKEQFKEWSENLKNDLGKLKDELEANTKNARAQLDKFGEDLSKAFTEFKKSFKE